MFAWMALASSWISLLTLGLSAVMLFYRPAMTDVGVLLVLYFGAPGALCLAGLVLWAHRRSGNEPQIIAQRLQAKVAIPLAILAAAIVYGLIIFSVKLEPV